MGLRINEGVVLSDGVNGGLGVSQVLRARGRNGWTEIDQTAFQSVCMYVGLCVCIVFSDISQTKHHETPTQTPAQTHTHTHTYIHTYIYSCRHNTPPSGTKIHISTIKFTFPCSHTRLFIFSTEPRTETVSANMAANPCFGRGIGKKL